MGTAFTPAKTSPASWDAFSDVEAFVDAVLAELAAMAADGTRPTRSGPKPPLTGTALRKATMAIRAGHGRLACGNAPQPSAVILDSPLSLSASGQLSGERSCRSAPACFGRGFDGARGSRDRSWKRRDR